MEAIKPIRMRSSGVVSSQLANALAAPEVAIKPRILNAAVELLIEQGTARTTTLAVQRRAGVSRGALLHHFPTHAELLSSTVQELVRRNEAAVHEALAKVGVAEDPFERAVKVLATTMAKPAYLAELELWAISRTDIELRTALQAAERGARKESDRVMRMLFPSIAERPDAAEVMGSTLAFLRGQAVTGIISGRPSQRQKQMTTWLRAIRIMLDDTSTT
ncbi:helix-turn-helix domain containing protein [Variovorax paradoxus]|jgi:AcrR family transcriptional regulator|uniref:Transcriptional regulator, TetR family n=1 Tax=Variovorax paradoxus (strain S110) TaxID=543728 RepID=C5D0B5_VARPS